MNIDVVPLPRDLKPGQLRDRACVVFDVLRATTTIAAALHAGVESIHLFDNLETARAAASAHRGDAFAACEFIMDYLKTRAPFWKKEHTALSEYWVDARASDDMAADRWRRSP